MVRPAHHERIDRFTIPGGFAVLEARHAGPVSALAGWSFFFSAALEESGGGGGLGVE